MNIESGGTLVVGAGPTGLTVATELISRGHPVRVIDRGERPHPHSRAIVLWPRALEALRRCGAADEIVDRALPLRAANYYTGGRRVARLRLDGLSGTRYRTPLSFPQKETEAVLRRCFEQRGGKIEYGVRMNWLRPETSSVHAGLEDASGDSTAEFDWAVGCDGAHSHTREQLGVEFEGMPYQETFALSDGECETPLAQDEAHYFMTPHGVLVVVGLPGGLYRVFVSMPPGADLSNLDAVVQQAAAQRCPVPVRLVGEQQTGSFQVNRRVAKRFQVGRVLLAGDAAHVHSPAGGQGMNTGIEDAQSLGWRLASAEPGSAGIAGVQAWAAERRYVAERVVADTDRQTKMWMLTGWRRKVRDGALAVASRTGVLDRAMPPRMAQLALAYPGSEAGIGVLKPGTRLPDVPLGDGKWLHDSLTGNALVLGCAADRRSADMLPAVRGSATKLAAQWTAKLGTEVDVAILRASPPESATDLFDAAAAAHRLLGISEPALVVIRPDGVVAHAAPATGHIGR
ncbi:FAD-dependent monooxygenase [Saccharopolyspora sp. K220]|uniref:FAD-dependent oxidoreductase n=1 Tax=Saccharopolyspora soli TaxID=2926618 RepID=UPI001F58416F|nr:FAD-dependent monooxygenase [Saccharopolyspora soli]MCI2416687.1 FAD-dependent monooxygenase [Saccharopolyspora soli]